MSVAVDADLALAHGLEQGSLGLGRRAVDLVTEQQVGEDGPGAEHHIPGTRVEHGRTGEVGGKHVWGELDPGELQAQGCGERARQQRLAEAGEVLDEDVPGRQDAEQHLRDRGPLADDDPLDLGEDLGAPLGGHADGGGEGPCHSCSSRSTMRVRVGRSAPGALLSKEAGRDGSMCGQISSPIRLAARAGLVAISTR